MQKPHNTAAMANRRRLIGLLLAAVFGIALFLSFTRDSQPNYHGKSLSEWVALYTKTTQVAYFGEAYTAQSQEAADAIRHIGTNAIPLLLALVDDPPHRLWDKGRDISGRMPDWIRGSTVARWARQHHPVILTSWDALGLSEVLGPLAAPATPELVQRLSSTNWTGRRDLALHALACTGQEATAFMAVMHLRDPHERVH